MKDSDEEAEDENEDEEGEKPKKKKAPAKKKAEPKEKAAPKKRASKKKKEVSLYFTFLLLFNANNPFNIGIWWRVWRRFHQRTWRCPSCLRRRRRGWTWGGETQEGSCQKTGLWEERKS